MVVMRITRWIVLAVAVVLAAGLACTGSDVLRATISEVAVTVVAQNVATGRYEAATIGLSQIKMRPVAPQADANLGTDDLGLLPDPVQLDLTRTGSIPVQTTRLSPGQYRVTELRFLLPTLTDNDPPAVPSTCLENFAQIPGSTGPPLPTNTIVDYRSDPNPPILTIGGESAAVNVTIDVGGLIALFESSFDCRSSGFCIQNGNLPAPCLNAFLIDRYETGFPALVGITP